MSDAIDMFRDIKNLRQAERKAFGLPCPECQRRLPRAHPKILHPGQQCRAHKPYYRDTRPEPTDAEWNELMNGSGWTREKQA